MGSRKQCSSGAKSEDHTAACSSPAGRRWPSIPLCRLPVVQRRSQLALTCRVCVGLILISQEWHHKKQRHEAVLFACRGRTDIEQNLQTVHLPPLILS